MAQRMRIAECMEYPWDQHGGVEVLVRELVHGLAQNHDVFVVSQDNAGLPAEVAGSFTWNPGKGNLKKSAEDLRDWLLENRIEIAHFHAGSYAFGAREWSGNAIPILAKSGIRCCYTNHGAFSIFDCVAPYRPIWEKLVGLSIFWPQKIRQINSVAWEATVSLNDLRSVQKWYFPCRSKFIQLYHSKIREIEPAPTGPKKPFILCLGTIGGRKGQHFLVEAFSQIAAECPEWDLVLAGRETTDPTYTKAVEIIQRNNLQSRVKLRHNVSDAAAAEMLRDAAIFAMPSTAEGLGLSLQEAQFQQCACIGSRIGGIPELIEDGKTGILVPMADPPALAAGLLRLIKDEKLRERYGKAGRQSVIDRGMTAPAMVKNYFDRYQQALTRT